MWTRGLAALLFALCALLAPARVSAFAGSEPGAFDPSANRVERVLVEGGTGLAGALAGGLAGGGLALGVCLAFDLGGREWGCMVPSLLGTAVGVFVGTGLGVYLGGRYIEDANGALWATYLGTAGGALIAVGFQYLLHEAGVEGDLLKIASGILFVVGGSVLGYELTTSAVLPDPVTGRSGLRTVPTAPVFFSVAF